MDQPASPVDSQLTEREVYLAVIKIDDPEGRDAFLDQVCGGRPDLRMRIERLIAVRESNQSNPLQWAVADSDSPLDTGTSPTMTEATPLTERDRAGSTIDIAQHPKIDRYKLLEEVGRGGMGTVYMAQQTKPVRRRVALKIINPGMNSREVLARFEAERQALAMMDHPNIASVFDGGTTEAGLPYFAMELVRGIPLTHYCREKRLNLRDRLTLFIDVCSAVQHAHQKGIIHRDLKPSNIMVTMHDDHAVVKVIDFGVAKALNQELTDKTLFTQYSAMVGTPMYMSPEQAQMSGLDVDTRSDIYSLGVILYELLTGTTPFNRDSLSGVSIDQFRKMLSTVEPPRPSTRVSTRRANQKTADDPRQMNQLLDSREMERELDWIVMKALEKDRERRYQSANGFARDIERYLDGAPVEACPPTIAYRLATFTRRHKGLLTTAALLSASLFLGASASVWYATKAHQASAKFQLQKTRAEAEKTRAENNLQLAIESLDEVYRQVIATERSLAGSDSNTVGSSLSAGERHLIETGLVFYERLAQLNGDDASIRQRVGDASGQIGWLRSTLGEHQAARKAFETAVACYQELAAEYPKSRDYAWGLAAATKGLAWQTSSAIDSVERRQSLLKQSVDAWSRYLKLNPQDAKALQERASVYWMLGDVKSAQADMERAIECDPGNPDHYAQICRLLRNEIAAGAKVLEYAEQAVRLDPENADYRVELAVILANQRKKNASFAQLQKALELDPKCVAAHCRLSRHHLRQRNFDQAMAHADQAVELNPLDPAGYYFRALVYGNLYDNPKALKDLDRALELSPREGPIRSYRADILCRLERYEEAEEEYNTAIHDRPAGWHVYKRRAALRFKFKRYAESLADLREALRRNPGDVGTVTWISPAFVAKCPSSEFRDGMKALADEAVQLNNGSADSRMARATLLNALGDFAKAKADLEAAHAKSPDRADIYDRLAWMLATCPSEPIRDPRRATEFATKAVELDPEKGSYLNTLGVAQFRTGQYSSAVDSLTKSRKLRDGGHAFDFLFLAMAHWQLDNKAEAREWYNKSLKWMKNSKSTDDEFVRILAEAEEMLGVRADKETANQDSGPYEKKGTNPESPDESPAAKLQKVP